jgi:RNA polymerase sigma-70 factor (ECF subfamily)
MAPSDEESLWVARAQCGDHDALELLLRSVQLPLYQYIRRLIGADDAEDVLQEVLIAIARKLTWLSEPRLFRAWAFRIASRASFKQLRKDRRHPPPDSSEGLLDTLAAPSSPVSQDDLNAFLDNASISPASRAVLVLHFCEEMPLAEVAAVLELPLGTVKSRLAYGLKALRRLVGDERSIQS